MIDVKGFDIELIDVKGFDIELIDVKRFDIELIDVKRFDIELIDVKRFAIELIDVKGFDIELIDVKLFDIAKAHVVCLLETCLHFVLCLETGFCAIKRKWRNKSTLKRTVNNKELKENAFKHCTDIHLRFPDLKVKFNCGTQQNTFRGYSLNITAWLSRCNMHFYYIYISCIGKIKTLADGMYIIMQNSNRFTILMNNT